MEELKEATDILGQTLAIDDYIVIPETHGYSVLTIAQIVRFTPKTVRIKYLRSRGIWDDEANIEKVSNKYVKVDPKLVMFGILKNSK